MASDCKAQFYPDGADGPTPMPEADKLDFSDMSLVNLGKFEAFLESFAVGFVGRAPTRFCINPDSASVQMLTAHQMQIQ